MIQKSISIKKIYAVIFLVLMAVLGISSVLLFINNKFYVKSAEENANVKTNTSISFSEQYPFEDHEQSGSSNDVIGLGLIGSYRNFVHEIANKTNSYLTSLNPWSSQLKKIQSALCDFNDGDIYFNGSTAFVKLPNGYLAGCFDYCPSTESWNDILDFSKWLNDIDIPYITLITPDKSDDSITVFPQGIAHGYSQMLDEYKTFLDANGLYYIEAKQILLSENNDLYSWFYQSDHHWNVHASFATAHETAKILNDKFSVPTNTSILDASNFKLVVYPDSFLGSYGKKLGDEWKEDMEVLYPTMTTDFHIEIPNYGIDKTGSFDTTLIDQSLLGETDSSYSAFLYGDRPLIQIENNTCDNGSRILVIKYSFADSLCPYLANTVQYLDVIDPRSFDGSIRSYIKQTEPDAVILCMGVVTEYDEDNLHLK